MAFNYTEEQAEELLSEMYAEIADLRETMSKHYHFRDRFMERPLYDLLKENDYEPNWQKLQQLLDDYSIHYCEDTEIKILVKEEKVTSGNCPSDFYEKKSYFKNLVNELATKKYKSQLVTNPSYNYISINIFHDREIVCVGIMLARKVIGVTRVYDCIDGFYLEIENLDINSHLYGIELLPERGEAGYIGPNCIEIEDTSKEIYYHVYLDRKVLKELGCDSIFQMNFITTTGKHSIKYGDRDEHFDHDFIKSNCGFAHACQFPSNPQRLSKNMQECKGFKPTQEELTMIRCDKFEDPPEKERTSLADRVLATQSKENTLNIIEIYIY